MNTQLAASLAPLLEQLVEQIAQRVLELQHELSPTTNPEEPSPWMGIEKAAAYLDWPKQRLYKLTAQGAIPHYKQEGRLLFRRDELDRWLTEFAQPVRRLAWPPNESY
jgi:excisionase family DNA binding protein